jgi:hypothetical protein
MFEAEDISAESFRVKHENRMGMERHDEACAAKTTRVVNCLADDALMSAVNGVKNADRSDHPTVFIIELANP